MERNKAVIFIKKTLRVLGPGFITGASDDDPSGIGTYSQTGALFGLKQLWTSVFTFPFMVVIQEMCGRIGMITGGGIGAVIKSHYGYKILSPILVILIIANTINIGADLGAMASSAQMMFGLPFVFWLITMALITVAMIVFVPYRTYVKYLKFLSITLLGYIATVFFVKQDWTLVLKATFLPTISFDKDYLMNFVAILGTTISPYLFFWQANEEAEEEIIDKRLPQSGEGTPLVRKKHLMIMRIDTMVGMFFSNLISFFVIDAVAITLGAHGMNNIQTANDAAQALRPFAGDYAYLLFAVGIIGTGLMAVPVLAGSTGYAVAETMNWKQGLSYKYFEAPKFYLVIVIVSLLGLVIHFLPVSPFKLLYYTAILNGVAAPPIMAIVLIICNNKKILGNNTNSWLVNLIGITITVVMAAAAIAMFVYI